MRWLPPPPSSRIRGMQSVRLAAEDGQGLRANAPGHTWRGRSNDAKLDDRARGMGVAARAADQGPRGRVRHHRDPPPGVRGRAGGGALFAYVAYDPKDDVVVIAVGGNTPKYPVVLRHLIWHPTEVDVD